MNKEDFLSDLLKATCSSFGAKDEQKLDIACRKRKYEETLDEMWKIYMINPRQIVEYNKQISVIKGCGCRVLRNGNGKHKIVIT